MYYKVTIRAKNIKASPYVDEKNLTKLLDRLSAHTEFRTLDKGTVEVFYGYDVLYILYEPYTVYPLSVV